MSEKKYLLTELDLTDVFVTDAGYLPAEWLEAHEYRERTCRMDELNTGEPAAYEDTDEVIFHCMSCHAERGIFSYDEDGNVYSEPPRYCPNCGARVAS